MLGVVKLQLVYTHERSCFAYISSKYRTNSEKSQCIQVLYRDKIVLLWVVFNSSVPEGMIACNPVLCRLLELDEGADVFVSPYGDVKTLGELYIEVDSPSDQEILEHNLEVFRNTFLDQLRFVVSNQKVVFWISTSMPIILTPKQTGMLVNNSRVLLKLDAFNSAKKVPQNTLAHVPKLDSRSFKNIGLIHNGMLKPYLNAPDRLVLRALPIDSDGKKNLIHPYTVFIHEDLLNEKYKTFTVILATMENIPPVVEDSSEDSEDETQNENQVKDLCVEVVLIDNVVYRSLCQEVYNENIKTVLIPKSLNNIITIENGTKIVLSIIGDKLEQPDHIDIISYTDQVQTEEEVIEKFKNCVIENTHSGKMLLINDGMIKQNLQICKGFLQFKLKPEKLKYTMLSSESLRQCTVAAKCLTDGDFELPKRQVSRLEYDLKNYCRTMKSQEKLVQNVVSHLYFEIHREATFKNVSEIKSNVLVTGLNGTGKTALCHIVQKEMTLWSHIIHCRSLKGRKDIPEVLTKAIRKCQEHSPAVLICDDIDSLVLPDVEGVSLQDISYYQRLAEVIKRMLQACSGLCVLLTAVSMKSLHPTLRQFAGKPLFTAHFDISELQQDERVELFKHLLNDKIKEEFEVDDDDVIKLAMDTAGNNVRDITDYLNKKIFKAVKKKKTEPKVKPRLVEDISKDKEKASGFDIWGQVGGLDNVKQELTECIFWPMMYPALFPSQSCGILLYGPPGTGKSLIGSCLARLAGVTLLAVKGPELLSKYIGQSEKAVRDIFDKADANRPCILFFDEFDSLAPKRGHDSTGVTDRVVNQLLARLDGAEGGALGPVVAATSRPDLIDPALLRAGRLQRHVYCALPSQKGRLEVLKTLAKSVPVEEDVDLEDLAKRTEGFSPADLKSVLVTAQLARLEAHLMSTEEKNTDAVVVRRQEIEMALEETKPSLSAQQRLFYDIIYKRFRGEPLSRKEMDMAVKRQKQKVTLA